MFEVAGGNKDEVANTQGQCAPTEIADARPAGKNGAVKHPDPDSPQSDWRVGLCERPGTHLEQQA